MSESRTIYFRSNAIVSGRRIEIYSRLLLNYLASLLKYMIEIYSSVMENEREKEKERGNVNLCNHLEAYTFYKRYARTLSTINGIEASFGIMRARCDLQAWKQGVS